MIDILIGTNKKKTQFSPFLMKVFVIEKKEEREKYQGRDSDQQKRRFSSDFREKLEK